jgi:hypothetical protein
MWNWYSSELSFPITQRLTLSTKGNAYGWKRDLPDQSDIFAKFPALDRSKVPLKLDLRNNFMPKIYNQGSLGSCTANAIACAFEYDLRK